MLERVEGVGPSDCEVPLGARIRSAVVVLALLLVAVGCAESPPTEVLAITSRFDEEIQLPDPDTDGETSLEAALTSRRSGREFDRKQIKAAELGQLLWAGQGITDERGYRTAPSAGALYPIELYVVTATTVGHYRPEDHVLEQRSDDRVLAELGTYAFGQEWVSEAPLVIAVVAVPSRTETKYGAVSEALVDRESGHVTQNVLLQATVLDLDSVPVGGFEPLPIARLLGLPDGHDVRYLIPIG